MYLTDLTDAQKNNIKGTVLMENWRSKYDFFLILDVIVYVDASGSDGCAGITRIQLIQQ